MLTSPYLAVGSFAALRAHLAIIVMTSLGIGQRNATNYHQNHSLCELFENQVIFHKDVDCRQGKVRKYESCKCVAMYFYELFHRYDVFVFSFAGYIRSGNLFSFGNYRVFHIYLIPSNDRTHKNSWKIVCIW